MSKYAKLRMKAVNMIGGAHIYLRGKMTICTLSLSSFDNI